MHATSSRAESKVLPANLGDDFVAEGVPGLRFTSSNWRNDRCNMRSDVQESHGLIFSVQRRHLIALGKEHYVAFQDARFRVPE